MKEPPLPLRPAQKSAVFWRITVERPSFHIAYLPVVSPAIWRLVGGAVAVLFVDVLFVDVTSCGLGLIVFGVVGPGSEECGFRVGRGSTAWAPAAM
jgi:hypothetical protein